MNNTEQRTWLSNEDVADRYGVSVGQVSPAKTETPEALEERAAKLRAEAAEVEAELRRQDNERRAALAARQRAFDEHLVASWDLKALDAEVERKAAELQESIRNDPFVLALVNHFHAQSRRRVLAFEVMSARGRLGHDISTVRLPDAPPTPAVADLIASVVEQVSSERTAAEVAELHARRDGD